MTEEKKNDYLKEMRKLVEISQDDPEEAHYLADEILCELLCELGYDEIVDIFDNINKWYA